MPKLYTHRPRLSRLHAFPRHATPTPPAGSCVRIRSETKQGRPNLSAGPPLFHRASGILPAPQARRQGGGFLRTGVSAAWGRGVPPARHAHSPCGVVCSNPGGNKTGAAQPYGWTAPVSSGKRDSNPRPLAPHASALPDCATARTCGCRSPWGSRHANYMQGF